MPCCRRVGRTQLDPDSPSCAISVVSSATSAAPEALEAPTSVAGPPRTPSEVLLRPGEDPRAELAASSEANTCFGLVGALPAEFGWSGGDIRWYAVWKVPGCASDLAGVHWGKETCAYFGLLTLNGGNFGGIRWRRYNSLESAQAGFLEEAEKHKVPASQSEKVFGWIQEPRSSQ
eukprot:Skav206775  [mRNA]  locus=scaffold1075:41022:41546:+ [translate_table: standard]